MKRIEVHPTAILDPKAVLGPGVEIGPFCVIAGDVQLQADVKLASRVTIRPGVVVGAGTDISEGVVIGGDPQDLSYNGEETGVRIGKQNVIREYVTIHRATGEGKETVIGDCNYLMAYTHVGHNGRIGNYNQFANNAAFGGHCEVGDHAVIGGMTGVHQFVKIGSFAMVGFHSKLTQDLPPYLLADGRPARIRGINGVGLKRNGFSSEKRRIIKRIYKEIFRAKVNLREGKKRMRAYLQGADGGERDVLETLLNFLERSERGICV
ncbi:MAG: acyl-ACP--UDP-N-acetylglucosamine O-acyltransferase [Candidatus Bipolaricaulia bacterium]